MESREIEREEKGWEKEINLANLVRGVNVVQRSWHPPAERLMKAMKKGLVCFAVKEVT